MTRAYFFTKTAKTFYENIMYHKMCKQCIENFGKCTLNNPYSSNCPFLATFFASEYPKLNSTSTGYTTAFPADMNKLIMKREYYSLLYNVNNITELSYDGTEVV